MASPARGRPLCNDVPRPRTALLAREVADIGTLFKELGDAEFDAPSLCAGWVVRDVLGHMGMGHATPTPTMLLLLAKHGFSLPKASRIESITMFAGESGDDIRRSWSEVMVAQHPRNGISKTIPAGSGFFDHLVHNQDIRRAHWAEPGRPLRAPVAGLGAFAYRWQPRVQPREDAAGLRLVASDLGRSAGDGPAIEGPGESVVLAGDGRTVPLADLEEDGVDVLRARIAGRPFRIAAADATRSHSAARGAPPGIAWVVRPWLRLARPTPAQDCSGPRVLIGSGPSPCRNLGISDRALFVKGVSPEGTRSLCPSTREFSRGFLCAGARQ